MASIEKKKMNAQREIYNRNNDKTNTFISLDNLNRIKSAAVMFPVLYFIANPVLTALPNLLIARLHPSLPARPGPRPGYAVVIQCSVTKSNRGGRVRAATRASIQDSFQIPVKR